MIEKVRYRENNKNMQYIDSYENREMEVSCDEEPLVFIIQGMRSCL